MLSIIKRGIRSRRLKQRLRPTIIISQSKIAKRSISQRKMLSPIRMISRENKIMKRKID